MARSATLHIGELARQTGCNVETIRYYERVALLPRPPRSAARYRLYDLADVRRLAFVRRARELGFTLDEVRALLTLACEGRSKRGCALDPQGFDAGKKVAGRKRHILVDALGLLGRQLILAPRLWPTMTPTRARAPPRRVRGGCAPGCHPSPTGSTTRLPRPRDCTKERHARQNGVRFVHRHLD
mgnify:CR=1 FL=1